MPKGSVIPPVNSSKDYIHYVVGIGASAGGLEAINTLFDYMTEDKGFSFVVVQHLSPNHKSLMDELLAKHTSMKIEKATENMRLKPNHIYLIPNDSLLTLKHRKFHLINKTQNSNPSEAIDVFFESLAEEYKEAAVGIILSGTGSDGTKGLLKIKEYGGTTIVQDPRSAKFDGMPNSAIASGAADTILPPDEIGKLLEKLIANRSAKPEDTTPELTANLEELKEIIALVRQHTPYDFSAYKEHTLFRRIKRRTTQLEIDTFQEYIYYLKNHKDELELLGKEFLIGVTRFFRDEEAFTILAEDVIPKIVANKRFDGQIKLWVTACSTGEEAFTIAMLLSEELHKQGKTTSAKIFATDVDPQAIEIAARGQYAEKAMDNVPEKLINRYFYKEGNFFVVRPQLRRMVIFAQHNIIKDPPFSKVDLVSCRNMLIYMKPVLQHKVLETLHFSLNVKGYLFLGSSESTDQLSDSLKEVSKKWNIYQVISKSKNFIFNSGSLPNNRVMPTLRPVNRTTYPSKNTNEHNYIEAFQQVLLEEQGYAIFFTDENLKLQHAFGEYKKYLIIPDKVLETNLLKLVPPGLSTGINLTSRRALRTKEKEVSKRLSLEADENIHAVTVVVTPFFDHDELPNRSLCILVRTENSIKIGNESPETFTEQQAQDYKQLELEEELKEVKEELRATVEELETSNEEMQSSNEELLSSNEELQSTNEELQSLNEELHTVNSEHQQKILELQELNDDLNNYLRSTEIGQVILDEKLTVRKFNPAAKKQINIIESDIGRPFDHLTYNFINEDLTPLIIEVIDSGNSIEREVKTKGEEYFLMKILPYYRHDGSIAGSIITFVEVTKVKTLNNLLSNVLSSSPNGIIALGYNPLAENSHQAFTIELINQSATNMLRYNKAATLEGKSFYGAFPQFAESKLFKILPKVALNGKPFRTELPIEAAKLNIWLEVIVVATKFGIIITIIDITDKKEADEELKNAYQEVTKAKNKLQELNDNLERRVEERTRMLAESEERFRLLSRSTNDAIWDWNLITGEFWWNEGFTEIFGHSSENIEPGIQSLYNRLHPDEAEEIIGQLNNVINSGVKNWTKEHFFQKADGTYAQVYNRGKLLKNEYDVPYRMLGSIVDISMLKDAQEELRRSNSHLRRTNNDLDNFVYTASHDLRAPVANLTGLMTLLTPPLNNSIQGKDKHLINMVNASVVKLKRTIDSLLEVTQAQKELERKPEWIYFLRVIEDIKVDLRQQLIDSRGKIVQHIEAERICYTYTHLRSILLNLVSNAIKYRSPDRKLVITINTYETEEELILEVKDNGLGLDKRSQEKIFTMFRRFHSHIEGTGIGLYIIKRIIESNEGSISVKSEKDVGTTFTVSFMLEKPVEENSAVAKQL